MNCCRSSRVCWDTSRAPRVVPMLLSGLCVDKSTLKGLGTGRKTQLRGGFVALLGNFSPDKIISPSVFLEEAGERCGKSLQEHGYLLQLMLQGFWTTFAFYHYKPFLRHGEGLTENLLWLAFLLWMELLRIVLGRGRDVQAETLEDGTLNDGGNSLTQWKSFSPPFWPIWPLPLLNKNH